MLTVTPRLAPAGHDISSNLTARVQQRGEQGGREAGELD